MKHQISCNKKETVLDVRLYQLNFHSNSKVNYHYWNLVATTHSLSNSTLTISGNGGMADYKDPSSTRWGITATLITKVIIEEPIISVGSYSFANYYTNIESLEIANSVLKINRYAFSNCMSLTSLDLPNHLAQIGEHAFEACGNLASINLPNSLTQMGPYGFGFCSMLASLILPNNLSIISDYCFTYGYSLTTLIIPVGVTTLQTYAFHLCNHLESVNISHTVTNISNYVFQRCYELTCVYYDGTTDPGSSASDVFWNTNVEKVRVSTNYGSGNTFCGKPTEIGVSCFIKMNSKTFSPTIKSKLSSSLIMKMKRHCGLFLFQ